MTVNCRYCGYRLDPFWVEAGYDYHGTCQPDFDCPHGVERGPRYCPFCRRDHNLHPPQPPEKPRRRAVETPTALVGHNHPQTSIDAAQRVLPSSSSKRRMILDAIRESGDGLCDWQLEHQFQWKHESASACRRSLVKDGWLKDSGRTRPVPDTGNAAIVWEVA